MGLRVTNLSGNQLFNFANGMMRITVVVEKIDQTKPTYNRPLEIHSAEVAILDSGIDLPLGTIKGINREINDVFNSRQDFATSTIGKQILTEKSIDVAFAVDANQMMDGTGSVTIANNVLYQMFSSGGYKLRNTDGTSNTTTMYKVAGTNGTTKRSSQCKTDLDFKGLFWRDGMLAEPQASTDTGELLLTENTRVTAYNNFNLCTMLEFIYKFSDEKITGTRFPYCSNGEPSMTEGEDFNKYKFKSNLLSDSREINKSFIEGIADYEDAFYTAEIQHFINMPVTETGGAGTIDIDELATAGGANKKSLGIVQVDENLTIATNPLSFKAREIVFGLDYAEEYKKLTNVDLTTGTVLNSANQVSKLREKQYVKIYVRGLYSAGANALEAGFEDVQDKTCAYILAKVSVDTATGRRRLIAVLPRITQKGLMATAPTIELNATVLTGTMVDYNTKAHVEDFLIPVYDWDFDLMTMDRISLLGV